MTDENVTRLPVRFKAPIAEEGRSIQCVDAHFGEECNHSYFWRDGKMVNVTFLIRPGETEVECSNCRTRLEPMWVLRQLANTESQHFRAQQRYVEEMKRLGERSRTKCERCGHMTRISRTKPRGGAS
ncbi:hypothetical protein [Methylobacterium platani]|uniref:Uncharacterized protein n=2 Tax=Methylobacterium platani TaxID=427683 RepID=A0A179SFW2_9HYPH|nr:hypothetical protein [Methylobacterium platani]KMO21390.1 hypothetical protein SQ03_03295 [Methylobacterium platani JCM 14648]OAS26332.1 hypothetical protein A5481_06350 [Methylobacterium platani]